MSDSIIETVKAGAILEPLLGDLNSRGIPILGTVELTDKCNLRCVHCFLVEVVVRRGCLWWQERSIPVRHQI